MSPLEFSPEGPPQSFRSKLFWFLFRTNPFYLLSAMCMLGGCLALTNSLSWTSIPLPRLLALIVTLNVYEGMLLGLGLYLLARRGIVRDGLMLLFLEALFLVDAAFLNVEVFAIDLRVGTVANAVVFALAVVKLLAVFRALGLRRDGRFGLIVVQLCVLFGTPGVFAWVSRGGNGALPPGLAYGAWWAVALVAALPAMLLRGRRLNELLGQPAREGDFEAAFAWRSLVWLPMVSMLGHLLVLHWVYDAHVHAAYVAPVLFAAAVVLGAAVPTRLLKPLDVAILKLLLPALGVALSIDAPESLRLAPLGGGRLVLTPLFVSLSLAYGVYVSLYLARHALRLTVLGAAAMGLYAFGPTPAQVAAAARQGSEWAAAVVAELVDWVVPKTVAGWGVTAVGAAFGFLGLGAAVSLRRPLPRPADEALHAGG